MEPLFSDRASMETYIRTRNLTLQRAQQSLELLTSGEQAEFDAHMNRTLMAYIADGREQLFVVQSAAHALWAAERDGDQPYNNIPAIDGAQQTDIHERLIEYETTVVQAAINDCLPVADIHQELEHVSEQMFPEGQSVIDIVDLSVLNVARAQVRTALTNFEATMTAAYSLARSLNINWNSAVIPHLPALPDEYSVAA